MNTHYEGYTEYDNQTHQIDLVVESLGNGYDKYVITHDGQRVQGGVVEAGKAMAQVKKYCKRAGITSLFVA